MPEAISHNGCGRFHFLVQCLLKSPWLLTAGMGRDLRQRHSLFVDFLIFFSLVSTQNGQYEVIIDLILDGYWLLLLYMLYSCFIVIWLAEFGINNCVLPIKRAGEVSIWCRVDFWHLDRVEMGYFLRSWWFRWLCVSADLMSIKCLDVLSRASEIQKNICIYLLQSSSAL